MVRESQAIHVEDLNIVRMVANRRLARAVSDAGWGQFVQDHRRESRTVRAHRAFGVSVVAVEQNLLHRWAWACARRVAAAGAAVDMPACRAVHDRDHNAAKVILAAGRAERLNASHTSGRDRASGSGGAPVSPPPLGRHRVMKQEAPNSGVAAGNPRTLSPRSTSNLAANDDARFTDLGPDHFTKLRIDGGYTVQ